MMPVNTFASEFLRKLSKKDYYSEFDANQIFLSIKKVLFYGITFL
jgi:hypothetical protein